MRRSVALVSLQSLVTLVGNWVLVVIGLARAIARPMTLIVDPHVGFMTRVLDGCKFDVKVVTRTQISNKGHSPH
ncbi:hypothetical protein NL676_001677 [Syzygium grande]|nr:hypothetical protein NL676_001677 [Syzygium grande]